MSAHRPFVIALTGGIASGKSTVERLFRAHGIHVHDADRAARAVVEPGTPGLARIVEAFGRGVLNEEGQLDRRAMREHVFANPAARAQLEAIVHPLVRQWLHQRAMADTGPYCLLSIPLLAENIAHYRWVDRILLVDAGEDAQLQRLMARDGTDEALARRMLASQATREERHAIAHDVIGNHGDPAELDAQVAALHATYLALAAARAG